jgi:hypothetical protein
MSKIRERRWDDSLRTGVPVVLGWTSDVINILRNFTGGIVKIDDGASAVR